MGGLFKSPETVKAPIVPDVEAVPKVGDKPARKRRRGGDTILTGELEPTTTKKTLLGGR